MKYYLKNIGFTLILIGLVLGMFDFLLENYLVILIPLIQSNIFFHNLSGYLILKKKIVFYLKKFKN